MDILTSNIISYAFSPVLWVIKSGTRTIYNYITGRKIVTISDRMIEQQEQMKDLQNKIKSLTEYIVDNNIHHSQSSNILLDDYEVIENPQLRI